VNRARIGCSGWNYTDWRGPFYPRGEPQRRWLELYAQHFDTVEVNATFYRLPTTDTVHRWAESTPSGFSFAVKASRYLTHIRRLVDPADGMRRFAERLEPLAAAGRLGPVLWQLPESFRRDDDRLGGWLAALAGWPVRHAIEFRHPSWFAAPVRRALHDQDVALVVGDHPERRLPRPPPTADWSYARLHYGARGGAGAYAESELGTWARRVGQWRRRGDVYVYLNNDWSAFAPRNAASLAARLGTGPAGNPAT
jgi:uncharacterized protein YecE (DUF72 family)